MNESESNDRANDKIIEHFVTNETPTVAKDSSEDQMSHPVPKTGIGLPSRESKARDMNGCGCDDLSDYYRKLPHWKLYIEDPVMRGSNYHEYGNYVRPQDIEIKITPYKKKGFEPVGETLPVASNYAFHTSVSM